MRDSRSYHQPCVTTSNAERVEKLHDEALSCEDFCWIRFVPTMKYIGDGGYNEDLNARIMPTMANFLAILIFALGAISNFRFCESMQYITNNVSFWLPLPSINMTCTNNGNNITGGHIPCTYTPPYAMSSAGSSENFRNIISYNSDGLASLGFEQVNPGAFCLSIYWFYPSDSSGGMVWRANRDQYVDENATMSYLTTGVLELRNSQGNLVWFTDTKGTGAQNLVFQADIANLMLWDKYNNTVWQSFDHPTNKILRGQSMLPKGDPVYSSLDENSQTQGIGNYSLVMGAAGLILYVILENKTNPLPYWAYGYYGSNYTSSIMSTCNLPIYAEFFTNLTGTQYVVVLRQSPTNVNNGTSICGSLGAKNFTSLPPKGLFKLDPKDVGGASVKKAMKVNYKGELVLMLWNSPHDAATVNQPLFGDDEPCKLPKVCYQYGVCNPRSTTQCSCPSSSNASESFTPRVTSDLTQGCSIPGEHVSCENGSTTNQYLVRLSGIDYFANNFMEPLQMTMNNCAQTCLQNCTCYAAFYRIGSTECFHTFQPVMTLTNQSNSNYMAFIKLQKSSTRANSSSTMVQTSRWRWPYGILGGAIGVISITVLLTSLWWVKFIRVRPTEEDIFLETLPGLPPRYQFKELEVATDKFTHKLGQGGSGVVYKGTLADGTEVAVKRLEGDSMGQGRKEFRAEVATIGNIHHFNLVRLCGFCVEGSYRMLVYEFMEHGSLDRLLFKKNLVEGEDAISLDWLNRLNIAICTARGLAYLHEECWEKILHLDIKPQNILLDKNFVAKVADFGLAKLTKRDQSLVMTQMRGTPGYLAPEWLLLGAVTEKVDVYSYGMVLLELISGRRNIEQALDTERWFFPAWASQMYTCGDVMDLVDKRLEYERPSKEEVKRVLRIAFWCIQEDGTIRPSMGSVVQMLEGNMEVHEPPINFDFLETTQKMVAKIMHSFSIPISLGSSKTSIREEEPPNPPNTTTYEPPNCVIYEDMKSMEMDS